MDLKLRAIEDFLPWLSQPASSLSQHASYINNESHEATESRLHMSAMNTVSTILFIHSSISAYSALHVARKT
jgi:hypothetical protein